MLKGKAIDSQKINRYDPHTLKGKIDQKMTQKLNLNFRTSNKFTDIKIILGLLATLPPIYTHFGPYRFPQNYNLGVITTAWYFLLCVIYYFIDKFYGVNTFYSGCALHALPNKRQVRVLLHLIHGINLIKIQSFIKRFQEVITFKLSGELFNKTTFMKQFSYSVGEFYTSDGRLVIDEAQDKLDQMMKEVVETSKED